MTKRVTNPFTGETLTVSEWARRMGMNQSSLSYRLKNWTLEKVFSLPTGKQPGRLIEHPITKEVLTLTDWAKKLNMHPHSLAARIDEFRWPLEKALTEAPQKGHHRMLTHPVTGETFSLTDWAKKLGMHPQSVAARIDQFRWPLDKALTEAPQKEGYSPRTLTNPVTKERLSLARWAIKLNKSEKKIRNQIDAGVPLEIVLATREYIDEIANKELTHPITGETLTLYKWADKLGLFFWQLNARLEDPDWSLEHALSLPFQGERSPR